MPKQSNYYQIDGIGQLPRVTAICSVLNKPALINWASSKEREAAIGAACQLFETLDYSVPKMTATQYKLTLDRLIGTEKAGRREMEKAAEIGKETHARCEWALQRQLGIELPEPVVSGPALWASMAAEDWFKQTGFKVIFAEQTIYSSTFGYAGTADMFGLIGDDLVVGDFKTGKSVSYPEYRMQIAAYSQAFEELGHGRAQRGYLLRLPKTEADPGFESVEVGREEMDYYFEMFKHCIPLFAMATKADKEYWSKRNAEKVTA